MSALSFSSVITKSIDIDTCFESLLIFTFVASSYIFQFQMLFLSLTVMIVVHKFYK